MNVYWKANLISFFLIVIFFILGFINYKFSYFNNYIAKNNKYSKELYKYILGALFVCIYIFLHIYFYFIIVGTPQQPILVITSLFSFIFFTLIIFNLMFSYIIVLLGNVLAFLIMPHGSFQLLFTLGEIVGVYWTWLILWLYGSNRKLFNFIFKYVIGIIFIALIFILTIFFINDNNIFNNNQFYKKIFFISCIFIFLIWFLLLLSNYFFTKYYLNKFPRNNNLSFNNLFLIIKNNFLLAMLIIFFGLYILISLIINPIAIKFLYGNNIWIVIYLPRLFAIIFVILYNFIITLVLSYILFPQLPNNLIMYFKEDIKIITHKALC